MSALCECGITAADGGLLTARVRAEGVRIAGVDLQLQRPLQILRGLDGRTPEECLRLLPLLFPMCGSAHALAALQAVESAAGIAADPAHEAARATLVLADAMAAHVWRECIDWMHLLQVPAEPALVAAARGLVGQIARASYPDGDWCRPGGGRLAPDLAALEQAREVVSHLQAGLQQLQASERVQDAAHLALAGAGALWRGWLQRSIADQADATRASLQVLAARLKSTGALLPVPAAAEPCERLDGSGQGSVQTARGPLEYRLTLAQGRWMGCEVRSPTDRTFAPGGPATHLLARLHQAHDPLRAVRWVIAALDPCVAVEVRAAGTQA